MVDWSGDLIALMHQASNEQVQDMELHLIGHVIEHDPVTNMCRVLLPTRRAEDDNGNVQVMETGWIQVGSGQVGDGHGDQYHMVGGATAENPEQGEQVQVSIQHRASGLCAVANLTYNDTMQPPGAGPNGDAGDDSNDNATDDDGTLQLRPAERIIKQRSGTFIKLYSNGDIGIFAAADAVIRVHTDCKVIVEQGDLDVDVQLGNANVTLDQGDLDVAITLGDAAIHADQGTVDITGATAVEINSAGEVDVIAPHVNILSGIVNAGMGPLFQALANAFHVLTTYNTHTHPAGGPPVPQAVVGVDTTIDLAGS